MKRIKIKANDFDTHVDCPDCDNWEQLGVDEPRKRLNVIPIIEWLPDEEDKNEVSINKCTNCNCSFELEWDYSNVL